MIERRIYPFDEPRLSARRSRRLHVPAVVLDDQGRWHDVAACSDAIRLDAQKETSQPRLCRQCSQMMVQHGMTP